MFGEIGFDKLLMLLVMFLLLFGAKRIPEIGRSLGKGIREFKGSLAGLDDPADGIRGRDPAITQVESALDTRINNTEPVRRLSS
jgi:TatA/E family protein of Tat protein translocase